MSHEEYERRCKELKEAGMFLALAALKEYYRYWNGNSW